MRLLIAIAMAILSTKAYPLNYDRSIHRFFFCFRILVGWLVVLGLRAL